jgi:hypothetical protein
LNRSPKPYLGVQLHIRIFPLAGPGRGALSRTTAAAAQCKF